jgi:hypothetical protein
VEANDMIVSSFVEITELSGASMSTHFDVLERIMKIKLTIFLCSVLIGGILTGIPAYLAGFTAESIRDWIFNGLFATAIIGFIGVKVFVKNEIHRR